MCLSNRMFVIYCECGGDGLIRRRCKRLFGGNQRGESNQQPLQSIKWAYLTGFGLVKVGIRKSLIHIGVKYIGLECKYTGWHNSKPKYYMPQIRLVTMNRSPLQTDGQASLQFMTNSYVRPHTFQTMQILHKNIILGQYLLQQNGARIKIDLRSLRIKCGHEVFEEDKHTESACRRYQSTLMQSKNYSVSLNNLCGLSV